jgi:hypothetical protein
VGGAHKALVESHVQFGILNSGTLLRTLRDYQLLILPEQCIRSPGETAAIREFVRNGGGLVVTGETGVRDMANRPLADFALADILGVRRAGISELRRASVCRTNSASPASPGWTRRSAPLTRAFRQPRPIR